jgi:hypothetical protein
MAIYNILELALSCPRCGNNVNIEAEFRFGFRNLERYHIGDKIQWKGSGVSKPKQRPQGGNYEGEGYSECPICHKDFWISMKVRNDILVDAEVDVSRDGYIP